MTKRDEQRSETRERIVAAAVSAFSELGFQGASTREIAARAGANQGLITYHFRSKDDLWRAAADKIFGSITDYVAEQRPATQALDPRSAAREAVRAYVRYAAGHPELFRFMIEAGKTGSERMQWLVDTHLRPHYDAFSQFGEAFGTEGDTSKMPHAYYVMAGAGSVIFAVAPECQRLTGLNPEGDAEIETHADFVARLLVP